MGECETLFVRVTTLDPDMATLRLVAQLLV
jgi:hypothetical protein